MSRYMRQEALIGDEAQRRIRKARVAVIGAGGLGSPALLYLAAAGIGSIVLIDDDTVSLSNLHRQVIHSSAAIGELKTASAQHRLQGLNPDTSVEVVDTRLTWDNAMDLISGCDVVVDGADNFHTRHIASHAAARLSIPHVWGSILGYEAQMSVFHAGRGPVYEDLFPAPPPPGSVPSCAQAGVLGPLVGVVGSSMAMEVLKIVTGLGDPLIGSLGYYDSLPGTWEYVPLVADPAVAESIRTQSPPRGPEETDEIASGAFVLDVRTPEEFAEFHLPGSINVPLADILDGTTPEIENGAVVVCASGVRSAQAVETLTDRGVPGLASLKGGLNRVRETQNG